MSSRHRRRERREAARRRQQRRRRLSWGIGIVAVAVVLAGAVSLSTNSADDAAVAPDFELATVAGDTINLSDLRGQPIALTFMHTY